MVHITGQSRDKSWSKLRAQMMSSGSGFFLPHSGCTSCVSTPFSGFSLRTSGGGQRCLSLHPLLPFQRSHLSSVQESVSFGLTYQICFILLVQIWSCVHSEPVMKRRLQGALTDIPRSCASPGDPERSDFSLLRMLLLWVSISGLVLGIFTVTAV